MEELWKAIDGYPHYEVSTLGRVRSLGREMSYPGGRTIRWKGRILQPRVNTTGYIQIGLRREDPPGHRWDAQVHRLVLETFVGPCPEDMECCHNDGDRANNVVSNLRWDTKLSNAADVDRMGRRWQTNREVCPSGHPYLDDNLYVDPKGYRRCRTCRYEQDVAQRKRRKAARTVDSE